MRNICIGQLICGGFGIRLNAICATILRLAVITWSSARAVAAHPRPASRDVVFSERRTLPPPWNLNADGKQFKAWKGNFGCCSELWNRNTQSAHWIKNGDRRWPTYTGWSLFRIVFVRFLQPELQKKLWRKPVVNGLASPLVNPIEKASRGERNFVYTDSEQEKYHSRRAFVFGRFVAVNLRAIYDNRSNGKEAPAQQPLILIGYLFGKFSSWSVFSRLDAKILYSPPFSMYEDLLTKLNTVSVQQCLND